MAYHCMDISLHYAYSIHMKRREACKTNVRLMFDGQSVYSRTRDRFRSDGCHTTASCLSRTLHSI